MKAWVQKHRELRVQLGMKQDDTPWTGDSTRTCHGVPVAAKRVRDALDLSWGSRPVESRSLPWYFDVSQNPTKHNCGLASVPCTLSSSRIFDFSRGTLIIPADIYYQHGFPAGKMTFCDASSTSLFKAVGESMFLGNVASILYAFYLNDLAPWWTSAAPQHKRHKS